MAQLYEHGRIHVIDSNDYLQRMFIWRNMDSCLIYCQIPTVVVSLMESSHLDLYLPHCMIVAFDYVLVQVCI